MNFGLTKDEAQSSPIERFARGWLVGHMFMDLSKSLLMQFILIIFLKIYIFEIVMNCA